MRELLHDQGPQRPKGCRKHGNQHQSFFCKTCQVAVCRDCCLGDHKESAGHVTMDFEAAVHEQQRLLDLEIQTAQSAISSSHLNLHGLKAESRNLFAAKDAALTDIDQTFTEYIEALKQRQEALKQHVREGYGHRQEQLGKHIEEIQTHSTRLGNLVEECNMAKLDGTLGDLLAYNAKISNENAKTYNLTANQLSWVNFIKFDGHQGEVKFTESLSSLGNVKVEEKLPNMVHVKAERAVAGLPSRLVLHVDNIDKEAVSNCQLALEIIDPYDDLIPNLVTPREDGNYEVNYRPEVSGTHLVKTRFCGHLMKSSGDTIVNVQSNNPVFKLGAKGSASGEFQYPRAVAVDAANNIYVVDTGNCRIQRFDPSGKYVYEFPICEKSDKFSTCGIAVNNNNNTLVCPEVCIQAADLTQAHSLLIYTMDGQLKQRLDYISILKRALCTSINSQGHIVVADFELNAIFVFDKNGSLMLKVGHPEGKPGSDIAEFNHPTFVCIGKDDAMIVSDGDNHRIQVFDKNGKFLFMFGSQGTRKGQFLMPFGVVADKYGNILVVDGGNKRIQIFGQDGKYVSCIESLSDRLNAPRGISVTNDGQVLVADRDNNCIKKFRYM